jgi:hypothetical protein
LSQLIKNSLLSPRLTHVVQLARAGVHSLEQLIDLIIAHLLAEVCKDVAELAHADKSCELFVEYLEAAAVLFGLAGVAESTRAVEDALEVVKVDCRITESVFPHRVAYAHILQGILTVAAHLALKVLDLCESRVLAACSEKVAQVGECDTAVAALVEEGEGLLEVGALRLLVGHA